MPYLRTVRLAGAAVCAALLLSGCPTTGGGNVKVWNPWTWFTRASAAKVEKTETKIDEKREQLIDAAQIEANKTVMALAAAQPSRPVEVAVRTANNTADLLDKANGSLTPEQAQELRKLVTDLISENAEIRGKAEKKQGEDEKRFNEQAAKLTALEADLEAYRKKAGIEEKKNAELANAYKNLMFKFWATAIGLGLLALLTIAGTIYYRLQFGGLRLAMGRALADGDAAGLGASIRSLLDPHLNRDEQAGIKKQALKELAKILQKDSQPQP